MNPSMHASVHRKGRVHERGESNGLRLKRTGIARLFRPQAQHVRQAVEEISLGQDMVEKPGRCGAHAAACHADQDDVVAELFAHFAGEPHTFIAARIDHQHVWRAGDNDCERSGAGADDLQPMAVHRELIGKPLDVSISLRGAKDVQRRQTVEVVGEIDEILGKGAKKENAKGRHVKSTDGDPSG